MHVCILNHVKWLNVTFQSYSIIQCFPVEPMIVQGTLEEPLLSKK